MAQWIALLYSSAALKSQPHFCAVVGVGSCRFISIVLRLFLSLQCGVLLRLGVEERTQSSAYILLTCCLHLGAEFLITNRDGSVGIVTRLRAG
jgi:hypothetical protein